MMVETQRSLMRDAIITDFLATEKVDRSTQWRPCPACVALGGYDPARWPRFKADGSPSRDFGWPCDGHSHGRPEQILPDGPWEMWMAQTGRGWGKTKSYCSGMIERRLQYPKTIAAVAMPTLAELRRVAFDGESGFIACLDVLGLKEGKDYQYNRSLFFIKFTNGSLIQGFSSEAPESSRGFQSHDLVIDEPGSFRDQHLPEDKQTYQNLKFGHRLPMPDGSPNREIVVGTPRRRALVKKLNGKIRDLLARDLGVLVGGSTHANAANLSGSFLQEILAHEGTQLGQQEIDGLLLGDVDGAMWKQAAIDFGRVSKAKVNTAQLGRRVVAVDPAASDAFDEVGIIGAGVLGRHAFVLGDWSCHGMPEEWAEIVVDAALSIQAHAVVVETNLVGSWMTRTIQAALDRRGVRCPIVGVRAGKGQTKEVRADPVSMLYAGETPTVHHVGVFPELEDEQCSWVPGESKRSPNRIDALVWAILYLLFDVKGSGSAAAHPSDAGYPEDLPRSVGSARPGR